MTAVRATIVAEGLAVAATAFALFAPVGRSVSTSTDSTGRSTTARSTHSLWESEGASVLVAALIPAMLVLAVLSVAQSPRLFRPALISVAALVGLFVVATGFSIGLLYLPTLVALIVAVVRTRGDEAR